jgi:hypothetical protein
MPKVTAPKTTLSFDMGYKNLAFAQVGGADQAIQRWEVVNIVEGKTKAKKPSIELVTRCLVDYLKQNPAFVTVDRVLIEIQPAGGAGRRSNTMMKVLSHVLQAFFHTHNIPVRFVSPKKKLKGCRCTKGLPSKQRYAVHKQYAIEECRKRLSGGGEAPTWSTFFESHTKKDDLADCLLQCFVD